MEHEVVISNARLMMLFDNIPGDNFVKIKMFNEFYGCKVRLKEREDMVALMFNTAQEVTLFRLKWL